MPLVLLYWHDVHLAVKCHISNTQLIGYYDRLTQVNVEMAVLKC